MSARAAATEQIALRARGAIVTLSSDDLRALLERGAATEAAVRDRTAGILARVREQGDAALRALAEELDGVRLDSIEVPRARLRLALDALTPELRRAMERAARNIATAHEAFRPRSEEVETEPGVLVGRRPDPLGRVGVYAPGGRAAYPSSLLMGAIPARVAGVGEVIVCSPPDSTGAPASVVLAAAALAGVDRVFAVGGAGAIGAMAFGTETIPRVDRIVGPGNAYVAEAKLQVSRSVAIDSPAGPSELLVIADESTEPELVARELVAQAEHDPSACAVAVLVGGAGVEEVERALADAVLSCERHEIVRTSLAANGALLSASSTREAVEFVNRYAPEHLLLAIRDPEAGLAAVRHAGTVFLGASSSVSFGDYLTGANHVLPTGGLARSYAGLSTLDFIRWTSYQRVIPAAASRLADDVAALANAEGLPGHAAAALRWRAPEASVSEGER